MPRKRHTSTNRWRPRPAAARALGGLWSLGHVAIAVVVADVAAITVGRPHGALPAAAWFAAIGCLAAATLVVTQRVTARVLPLRALLALDLAFPAVAPSRFKVALRSGSTDLAAERLGAATSTDARVPTERLLELVAALARHDWATRGHSERVRAYVELIAEELALEQSARDGLRWAGLIHDVGKLRVPGAVLNNPGPLSARDWELIRRHPEDGAALAAPLEPWLGVWTTGVLDHHERWDGAGYPRQLAGTDISLAGRVIAVADAFDVMTSARSYKQPRSADDARVELVACAGSQFDPDVVRAFLAISIKRLRGVIGPLALFPAAITAQWRWRAIASRVAAPGIAALIAIGAFAIAPHPSASRDPTSVASTPALRRGGVVATRLGDTGTPGSARANDASVGSPARRLRGPSPSGPDGSVGSSALASGIAGASGVAGGAVTNAPGSLVVDPKGGTVSIDDVGPAKAPPVNVVKAPGTGPVTCGGFGLCAPIAVPLPLS